MLFVLLDELGSLRSGRDGTPTNANWSGPENNFPLNWSYDNQTVINSQNVNQLQVKWTFPVPAAPVGTGPGG